MVTSWSAFPRAPLSGGFNLVLVMLVIVVVLCRRCMFETKCGLSQAWSLLQHCLDIDISSSRSCKVHAKCACKMCM